VVDNLRLLLLSATPMFNSYKEIIWLINLMNMNDRRSIIGISDIFDKKGKFKNKAAEDLFIQKITGYVSYVRGENPYTFPFRVYPDQFAEEYTISDANYPKCQINGKPIKTPINKLNLFITAIGKYQELGYKYIVDRLRARQSSSKVTRTGKTKNMPSFNSLKSFGYTDLMNPIEALNIVYPLLDRELEELTDGIKDMECLEEEGDDDDDDENDLTPSSNKPEMDSPEEIEEILKEGPKPEKNIKNQSSLSNSELESELTITEGLDANPDLFDEVFDQDINIKKMNSNKDKSISKSKKPNIDFDIEEEESPLVIENAKIVEKKPITSFSESIIPQAKSKSSDKNVHVIEGETESKEPTEANPVKKTSISGLSDVKSESNSGAKALEDYLSSSKSKGGKPSSNTSSSPSRKKLYINPKELTGTEGLKRIMDYTDSKTPAIKGGFEYKKGVPHIFEPDQIGNYSAKIKNVCDSIYHIDKDTEEPVIAEGIILIYSAYIDSGILPMALALEEMGFTQYNKKAKTLLKSPPTPVDVTTMQPPTDKKKFKPARYVMITGDPRISPDNDGDVKAITNDDNIFKLDEKGEKKDISGEKIKVVLISQAGSEGLDFKAIRQIHILEPWYNMNRNEQIIGRGVRNFSHKDLPFEKRNVQIFLYGTILKNKSEEAADLYVYRMAEIKAVKIGKVTRLLKETAVDCIINHEQTKFTPDNFKDDVTQVLSTGKKIDDFKIGDKPNTSNCDYMDTCEFKCVSVINSEKIEVEGEIMLNTDTYNEAYMLVNSDKIIQKVKALMKEQFFYKKKELFDLISIQKKYPVEQIYAALTQIINDNTEYILDKYGRTGYLVNIGDYYLFQPSELNFKNISMYNRSVPLDYKHNMINFEIKNSAIKPVIDKRGLNDKLMTEFVEIEDFTKGKEILISMYANFVITFTKSSIDRGNKNWYYLSAIVVRNMIKEGIDKKLLFKYIIEHIVDTLMLEERVDLMNFIWNNKNYNTIITEPGFKPFANNVLKYLQTKIIEIEGKNIKGMVIYDGISSIENLRIFVLTDKKWLPAEPEDKITLSVEIDERYKLKGKDKLNPYVGFIGFENSKKYMVYKIKDTTNERSTGYRCDQSSKEKVIDVLNQIEGYDKFSNKTTKDSAIELCVRQEITLRDKENKENKENKKDGTIWFLDTETAIYNEFEKRDKK